MLSGALIGPISILIVCAVACLPLFVVYGSDVDWSQAARDAWEGKSEAAE